MNPPLITAVMCTPGRGARRELAKIAVACFHRQTHPRKRLLILNHGLPLDIAQHPHVREIILGRPPTLGELRNQAFRYLETDDYAISWDDDDWYSPDRMGLQLTFIRHSGKKAAALYSYINVDIKTGEAFVRNCSHFQARCACGTMLYRVGTSDIRQSSAAKTATLPCCSAGRASWRSAIYCRRSISGFATARTPPAPRKS
jgi:glycosyltransferase involved in cell wall biosynthesis